MVSTVARLWTAVFVVAFGTNVPTPLLLVYRDELGLSSDALTGAFGVYAAGLVPALLLAACGMLVLSTLTPHSSFAGGRRS